MGDALFDDVMQVRNNCWAYVDLIKSRKKTKQKYDSVGAVAARFERDAIVRQEKKDVSLFFFLFFFFLFSLSLFFFVLPSFLPSFLSFFPHSFFILSFIHSSMHSILLFMCVRWAFSLSLYN